MLNMCLLLSAFDNLYDKCGVWNLHSLYKDAFSDAATPTVLIHLPIKERTIVYYPHLFAHLLFMRRVACTISHRLFNYEGH